MFDCELKYCDKLTYANTKHAIRNHTHTCYEIVYYISGKGQTVIGGRTFNFEPDTFFIIEPNVVHSEIGATEYETIYIGFEILNGSTNLTSSVYTKKDFDILEDLIMIKEEMDLKGEFYYRMLNLLTERILIKLKRRGVKLSDNESINDILNKVVEYIKLNCMKNISVKDIASHFGYSYDYFRTLFKKYMGISLKDYFMNEKLNYTINLIVNTNCDIKEAAISCGYASHSHFSMIFKKQMGTSPQNYIRDYDKLKLQWKITTYD